MRSVFVGGAGALMLSVTALAGPAIVSIGTLGTGDFSIVRGLSADGTVAAGYASDAIAGHNHAVRWSGGLQDLGLPANAYHSQGTAISADGSRVFGYYDQMSGAVTSRAFLWTAGTGIQPLAMPVGGTFAEAHACSADGTVAVGRWSGTSTRVVRWVNGMAQDIGAPVNSNAEGFGVSADGSVIAGTMEGFTSNRRAFRWTSGGGFQSLGTLLDLNAYLTNQGADLTGWVLTNAQTISADGTTLAGVGFLNGEQRGWIATVPAPGAAGLGLAAGLFAARRRRAPSTRD